MSKKRNNNPTPHREEASNPYELKTDAVERLTKAHSADYSFDSKLPDPGRQYRSSFLDRIPFWVKAVFMKFWFNGAVCYFILWGLGLFIASLENMILILAIVLGMVTDVLVNNAFRFFASVPGANDKWMMLPKKKLVNFFLNILYSFVVLIAVVWLYNSVNAVINAAKGTEGLVYIGVEPVLFGLFYVAIDLAFIGMKNLMLSIVNDAKKKNGV